MTRSKAKESFTIAKVVTQKTIQHVGFCKSIISHDDTHFNIFIHSALSDLCEGNPRVTSVFPSPHKGLVIQSFDVFFLASLNKLLNI